MRGSVDGLASPYSFGALLPAVYQEDELAMRWMASFDELLAPCVSTIDNVEHYFDPALAPADFVEMLAAWVGVELDETWSDQSRRALVAEAVALYRVRGTVAGLRRHVEISTGVEPEIEESGGCAVSLTSGGQLPGSDRPQLVVRVRVADPASVDERRLSRLVASSKPAHLPHRIEVLGPDDAPEAAGAGQPEQPEVPPAVTAGTTSHGPPVPGRDSLAAGEPGAGPLADDLAGEASPAASSRQPAEPGEEPLGVELSGLPAHLDDHGAAEVGGAGDAPPPEEGAP